MKKKNSAKPAPAIPAEKKGKHTSTQATGPKRQAVEAAPRQDNQPSGEGPGMQER